MLSLHNYMKHFFLEIKPVESDKKCDGDFNEQIVRYFTRCADICHKNYSGNMIVTKKTNNNTNNINERVCRCQTEESCNSTSYDPYFSIDRFEVIPDH